MAKEETNNYYYAPVQNGDNNTRYMNSVHTEMNGIDIVALNDGLNKLLQSVTNESKAVKAEIRENTDIIRSEVLLDQPELGKIRTALTKMKGICTNKEVLNALAGVTALLKILVS